MQLCCNVSYFPISNENIIYRLSKRKTEVSEQLNMRCKTDRTKLNGLDCWECRKVICIICNMLTVIHNYINTVNYIKCTNNITFFH